MRVKPLTGFGAAMIVMLMALAPGCKTTSGIILLDPQGDARPVTAEEVEELSGDNSTYLLQVGDQVETTFRIYDYRDGEVPPDYRIEVGDSMEVRLVAEMGDRDTYKIDVGDLIGISFLNNWPLNATKTVRPDGMLTMAEVGDVQAAGLTADQLRDRLVDLYTKTGIISGEPKITVNVDFANPDRLESMSRDVVVRPDGAIRVPAIKSDVRIAGLTVAEAGKAIAAEAAKVLRNPPQVGLVVFPFINTSLASMNGLRTVRPDGKISVARLGDIQAAGYSTEELRKSLEDACSAVLFNRVESSVDVTTVTGSRIYVGGEVGVPGVYPLASSPTALQAIMMSRGPSRQARMNNVLIMRRNPNGKPYVFKTNLHVAMTKGNTENDVFLRPFDIVFVPTKMISRANMFVEQYIEELIPFGNNMGLTATYYTNTQKVDSTNKTKSFNSGLTVLPTTTGSVLGGAI
ncbi:MAG: polysaccharide biosynthesis/export family protein [Candidatus Hydrogenedentes bacterium]|nr:polysaccharide biosynthesis/export family protein [Candidatus Hydrogenedentota bacterium]